MKERRDPIGRDPIFRVLAATQGLWGERIATTVRQRAPQDWQVETWAAPNPIPPIVDYPEDYLPASLPPAELVLSLGETGGLAQLIPDVCRLTGARAVIAPIDRNESLPAGLARQLKHWLDEMGVASVFPKPFCTLTQQTINRKPIAAGYDHPLIQRFAMAFGQPEFRTIVDGDQIARVEVVRDTPCGCASYVAENLAGTPVKDTLERAGMLHHHYPCLANMSQDTDYRDTLMHVSGNVLREALKDSLQEHLTVAYLRPSNLVEPDQP